MNYLRKLFYNTDGPTTVEYAIMLAMILCCIITAIYSFGIENGGLWSHNLQEIQNAHLTE
jgi:Flp pilus assembly pilin Flp